MEEKELLMKTASAMFQKDKLNNKLQGILAMMEKLI